MAPPSTAQFQSYFQPLINVFRNPRSIGSTMSSMTSSVNPESLLSTVRNVNSQQLTTAGIVFAQVLGFITVNHTTSTRRGGRTFALAGLVILGVDHVRKTGEYTYSQVTEDPCCPHAVCRSHLVNQTSISRSCLQKLTGLQDVDCTFMFQVPVYRGALIEKIGRMTYNRGQSSTETWRFFTSIFVSRCDSFLTPPA